MKISLAVISIFIHSVALFSQENKDSLFLKSKGTWNYPIYSVLKIDTWQDRKHMLDLYDNSKGVIFFSDKSMAVRAVHSGRVIISAEIDNEFMVITRYGDYFVGYFSIIAPVVKKGDNIKAGDVIGNCGKNLDGDYNIEILLYSQREELDAAEWFSNPGHKNPQRKLNTLIPSKA